MRAVAVLLLTLLATPLALPTRAAADQSVASGAGKLSASAHMDFKIVIPRVIALRVENSAVTADTIRSIHVLATRVPIVATVMQGVRLQSNMRAIALSQDPVTPALVTVAAP